MFYKLEGHNPVACQDTQEWAEWFETADRAVAQDMVGDFKISTIFLGIDHALGETPLLFETMIFQNGRATDNTCSILTT